MGLEKFTPDEHIFRDEDVLRDSHTPDDLFERDGELAEYQAALKPVINGARPRNIFLYGQTGVGKTLATKMVLERLRQDQKEIEHLDVDVARLQCKSLTSSYQVTAHLINEFRSPDDRISVKGYSPGMLYDMLWDELNALESTHVLIVLDEVDSIGTDDTILYELPRANDNGAVDETKIGVIGISNNFTFRDNLSGRVKDSLCDEEIHFAPYDATQLENILDQRADNAFRPDVLEDGVLGLCAAIAGQESGSARQALKLLYKSGDLARIAEDEMVTEEHVRKAEPIIKENKIERELERLPTQSHLTLCAVLRLVYDDALPARSNEIYEMYLDVAEAAEVDVKTDRTIRDRLSQLTLKGFLQVDEKNKGLSGGSFYEYAIGDIREDLIRDVLARDSRVGKLLP